MLSDPFPHGYRCPGTSTERQGREDFQICSIRSSEMSEENSRMRGFAKRMDSMPSPPTQLGKGVECGGRDCKLAWPLTLEDDFLHGERRKGSTMGVMGVPAQESRQHAPCSLLSHRYGRRLALDMRVRPRCLLHPSFHCQLQEVPHFRKWSHAKTTPVTI